jgi:hypothetical protein
MTVEELGIANTSYNRMCEYKKLANSIKEAREGNIIISICLRNESGSEIEISDNGLDFRLLIIKLEEELRRLSEEYRDEFNKL